MIRSEGKKVLQYSLGAITAMVFTALACVALPSTAHAYDSWANGCIDCHGDFNSGNYVSKSDATPWGTNLMVGHEGFLGSSSCNVCHKPPSGTPRSPVYIGLSAGITGFSPVSCLGCHGRAQDAKGATACVTGSATTIDPANCGSGAGLRKHHANSGVTECAGCHGDGAVTVFGESIKPAYYFTPDAANPNKPIDSCNAAASPGNENKYGLAGLDNDGDLLRDSADPDCVDGDSDGIPNGSDNCKTLSNASQVDSDGDGYGNRCDGDLNNNGSTNAFDTPLYRAQLGQPSVAPTYNAADINANGSVNAFDTPLYRALLGSAPGPGKAAP
jgi:hypothetical protein